MISKAWRAWDRFWFEFHSPLGLALMRVQLASVLLWMAVIRHFANMPELTEAGMVPRHLALPLIVEQLRPPFAWFFWPDSMAVVVHGVLIFCLLLVVLGVWTRFFAAIAWIFLMGFMQRNYSILFGADLIATLLLFYLAFTRCDERLSLLNLWKKKKDDGALAGSDAVSSAFSRLLQIQIVVIYAYTGFEKLKGSSWWDGTALWTVLGNPQMVMYDLGFLRHFPLTISVLTFLTVIFEIYFPVAMISSSLRKVWLILGFFFHCGIAMSMGLWTFSLVMMSVYWLLLSPMEVAVVSVSVQNTLKRIFPFLSKLR